MYSATPPGRGLNISTLLAAACVVIATTNKVRSVFCATPSRCDGKLVASAVAQSLSLHKLAARLQKLAAIVLKAHVADQRLTKP